MGHTRPQVPIQPVPVCHFKWFSRKNINHTIPIQIYRYSSLGWIEQLCGNKPKFIPWTGGVRVHGVASNARVTIVVPDHGHADQHTFIIYFKYFPVILHIVICAWPVTAVTIFVTGQDHPVIPEPQAYSSIVKPFSPVQFCPIRHDHAFAADLVAIFISNGYSIFIFGTPVTALISNLNGDKKNIFCIGDTIRVCFWHDPDSHGISGLLIFVIGVHLVPSMCPAIIKLQINIHIRNKPSGDIFPAVWVLSRLGTTRKINVIILGPPSRPERFDFSCHIIHFFWPCRTISWMSQQRVGISRVGHIGISKNISSRNICIMWIGSCHCGRLPVRIIARIVIG